MRAEGLLELRKLAVLREPFDSLDLGPVGLNREQHATLDQHSVVDDRASAAVARVAADVRPRESEIVTKEMHEQPTRVDFALVPRAVDLDADHQLFRSPACWTARAAKISARCRR